MLSIESSPEETSANLLQQQAGDELHYSISKMHALLILKKECTKATKHS